VIRGILRLGSESKIAGRGLFGEDKGIPLFVTYPTEVPQGVWAHAKDIAAGITGHRKTGTNQRTHATRNPVAAQMVHS
jgi:hypothetical protein